jgi:hypothetical protein
MVCPEKCAFTWLEFRHRTFIKWSNNYMTSADPVENGGGKSIFLAGNQNFVKYRKIFPEWYPRAINIFDKPSDW